MDYGMLAMLLSAFHCGSHGMFVGLSCMCHGMLVVLLSACHGMSVELSRACQGKGHYMFVDMLMGC